MREFQVGVNVPVTDQQIADWVVTAFEGGISYWCEAATCVQRDQHGDWEELTGAGYDAYVVDRVGPYANPEFWDNDKRGYRITTDEGTQKKVLTLSAIMKALNYQPKQVKGQSNNWYRKVTTRLLGENYDADDADILVQVAIFNEVIYG